jgi:hypothetical protein
MRFMSLRHLAAGAALCAVVSLAACANNTITIVGNADTPTATSSTGPVATLPPPVTTTPVAPTPIPLPTTPPTATPLPTPAPYTHLVYAQQNLTGGSVGPVTATCPAGQVALGGGWATSGYGNVYSSSRSGNSWQVYVDNYGSSDLVNAYVMCLVNLPSAVVTERLNQVSVPGSSSSTDDFSFCQPSETLVGGGFALSSTIFLKEQDSNATDQAWHGNFSNFGSSAEPANVYAICLQGHYSPLGPQGPATTVAPNSVGGSAAPCAAGYSVTGGGYSISSAAVVYNSSPTSNGWEAYSKVLSLGFPSTLTTTTQCIKFS